MVIHFEHFAVNRECYQWFAVRADLQLAIDCYCSYLEKCNCDLVREH